MASPRRRTSDVPDPAPRSRPATSPEAREKQLISMAVDLAEKQIREGTASAQVITHYLKMSASDRQEQVEKLRLENELLRARTEQISTSRLNEGMVEKALKAFRGYAGQDDDDEIEL
jgi:uncharacterized protein YcaQ